MKKKCPSCGLVKDSTEFWKNRSRPDGLGFYCKGCDREHHSASWKKHSQARLHKRREERTQSPNDTRRKDTEYRKANRGRLREYTRMYHRRIVDEFVSAYGGKCICCGETEPAFLTLDHMSNESRKPHKGMLGKAILLELRRRGWPQEEYRLHCFNCNLGRERTGGTCPHKIN